MTAPADESALPHATPERASFQPVIVSVFVLLAALSCIQAPYPADLLLQHSPTAVIVLLGLLCKDRVRLSNASFMLVVLFMSLHVLGGRYIYSFVPYDDWSRWLIGRSVSSLFGWERNHYDRLVHFSFGFLLAYPIREMFVRSRAVSPAWSAYFAVEFIAAASVLYELGEWLVALIFAPDWADRYLGQQGDMWDAQKDMGLAICGATLAMLIARMCSASSRWLSSLVKGTKATQRT
jgi:putative membrane protein